MKVGIVGAGISGLTAASLLHSTHEVHIFEANDYVGGHTNTVDVETDAGSVSIDTGFIVFNDRTYPNFVSMLDRLGVQSQPTRMSFSVRCDQTGLEYRGVDLNGLFAQRSNLIRPRFYRLMRDFIRFNRRAKQILEGASDHLTVREFFREGKFSQEFIEKYFLPMGSAIWSCPRETFGDFSARFVVEFYHNHGLLGVAGHPQWRVIRGGSKKYVEALTKPFANRIRTNHPILGIERTDDAVRLRHAGGDESFDHVVFACHSDQALRILANEATPIEAEVLRQFPYEKNIAILHTDTSLLPKRKNAWACWNYKIPEGDGSKATVTYNANLLQSLNEPQTYCTTLNDEANIAAAKIIDRFEYHHPIFTTDRKQAQARHDELINQNRTSFCGAYWGNGFHEDGVNSAIAVCKSLVGKECAVAST